MSFWKQFDKVLTAVERKGFKAANNIHYYSVNCLILGALYGAYTVFRDYNAFFLDARVNT